MLRNILVLAVCVSFSFGTACEPVRSDEPEHTTAKVLAAWKKRREAVHTLDYLAIGEKRVAKGGLTALAREVSEVPVGAFPPADRFSPVRLRFAARLRDKKLRFERQDDQPRGMTAGPPIFLTDHFIYFVDGRTASIFIPDEHYDPTEPNRGPQFRSVTDDLVIMAKDYPLLLAHGFVPVANRNITLIDLADPPAEVPYSLVDSPVKDDDSLVLRSKPLSERGNVYEIWVDKKRDYLITKWVSAWGAKTSLTADLTYKAAGDDWLLDEWRFVWWGKAGEDFSYKMKVKSVKVNEDLADDLFVLASKRAP